MLKNKDMFWAGIAAVLLVFTLGVSKGYANELPEGSMSSPSIEFACKGLRDVVFYTNGDLTINGKTFKYRGGSGESTLVFDNKVYMEGKRAGSNLLLDNAVIKYQNEYYRCIGQ